jgi:hypothetical protein
MIKKYKSHNLSYHPLYSVWNSMRQRCYNGNNKSYHNYGGRDIIVCNEWNRDFKTFYNWAYANGYRDGLQIDRIDNNGNYTPSNCRMVVSAVNQQNKRSNKLNWDSVKGIRLCGKAGFTNREIASYYGVGYPTVNRILNNKMWRV